jgi:copper ion binding protein
MLGKDFKQNGAEMSSPSLQTVELPITGMTCAGCVRNVERALKKTEGVDEASVNLATERARVEFDKSKVDVSQIIQRVQDAGYGVATASLELPITGMTCASCVRNVERAINKQNGIISVNVNLATEKASISFLPGAVRRGDIVKALEAAGYGVLDLSNVEVPEDAERAARQAEIDRQKRMVLIGSLFTLPLFALSMARDIYMVSFAGSGMASHILTGSMEGPNPALNWLLWSGWPFVFFLLTEQIVVEYWLRYKVQEPKTDYIAVVRQHPNGYIDVILPNPKNGQPEQPRSIHETNLHLQTLFAMNRKEHRVYTK